MATDSYIDLINDLLLSQLAGQNKSGKKRSSTMRTLHEVICCSRNTKSSKIEHSVIFHMNYRRLKRMRCARVRGA